MISANTEHVPISRIGPSTRGSVHFLEPLPGIGTYRDYTIESLEGAPGVFTIEAIPRNAHGWAPRLFLIDPEIFTPHYAPEIPSSATAALGTANPMILVVANPNGRNESDPITVNLLAPIILNTATHTAMQIVLDHSTGYGVAVPLSET
ncbi:MAG: flagellar assembly protein FliW [Ancrocorticia sp.]|jgi:flagellar assembly factor FliW|nr:flagellar assembly protein FliW [Ancrocorticia sp.]MCI2178362.1 flagellar assembly protein FliW [Ancrocorticia sp.]MCI2193168.1 flagellar assembly protein FliW [Ancrocorticia sp.]MCI2198832.1 flagellar assembly protein FliW [Ancrocorticia sp.]